MQLNELYNHVISAEEKDGTRSAGLGLMDMKLKSLGNLYYDFKPINDKYTLYTVQVNVFEH